MDCSFVNQSTENASCKEDCWRVRLSITMLSACCDLEIGSNTEIIEIVISLIATTVGINQSPQKRIGLASEVGILLWCLINTGKSSCTTWLLFDSEEQRCKPKFFCLFLSLFFSLHPFVSLSAAFTHIHEFKIHRTHHIFENQLRHEIRFSLNHLPTSWATSLHIVHVCLLSQLKQSAACWTITEKHSASGFAIDVELKANWLALSDRDWHLRLIAYSIKWGQALWRCVYIKSTYLDYESKLLRGIKFLSQFTRTMTPSIQSRNSAALFNRIPWQIEQLSRGMLECLLNLIAEPKSSKALLTV